MIESFKEHWQAYLMEFIGLAGFVLIAGLLTIFLEHPDMPAMKSWLQDYPLLRRIPLGIILGIYIALVVMFFGKKSGAHINPSATWTLFRLHKINLNDALFFTLFQFAGAIASAQLLKCVVGDLFGHPIINYGNTEPKPPHGAMTAFLAEYVISLVLMLMTLIAGSSKKLEKYVALMSGLLIAVYLVFEIPFSGMSLNPARSFAGAMASGEWGYLWIYFVAPTLAMLSAGEIYLGWKAKQLTLAISPNSEGSDYKEIPHYPMEKPI